MSDLKDRQFIRDEVKPIVRNTIPALQKAVEKLQARITALENPIGAKKDADVSMPNPMPKKETEPKPTSKKRPRKKK